MVVVSKSLPWLEEATRKAPKKPFVITPEIQSLIDRSEEYRKMQDERLANPRVRFMLGIDD